MQKITVLKLFIILALSFNKLKANEKDLYDFMWLDPDKKVYVLQNKVHKKERTIYINLGLGSGGSSAFIDTSLLHSNLGYYLNEEWAIELFYTKYNNKENDSFNNIQRVNGVVPFIRKPISNSGALIKWSPFYGKINTFNQIFYFDWGFGLGLGKYNTESNKNTVSNAATANTYSKESYNNLVGRTELSFHVNKNIHLGLSLQLNNYKAPGPTISNVPGSNKMRQDVDTIFSLGFSF